MKVLYIHNDYAKPSGEEHASGEIVHLLKEHGHEVRWFKRSSAEITGSKLGVVKSFFTGIYNPYSAKQLEKVLDEYHPEIVQAQNIYPLLSSSIFIPLKKRGIPVVMRCPNYRLFCPNGLCLDNDGEICEDCFNGGREINCIVKNCEKSILKSIGYAARNWYSRVSGNILNGVDMFIVQSEFQKNKFIAQGIPEHKIEILPGIAPDVPPMNCSDIGKYITFVGRVSAEKGIYEFIEVAKRLPALPFKVAGNLDGNFRIPNDVPSNLEFLGFVGGEELNNLYQRSRIIVVPSKWYEGFPNVIVRGMLLERPIVTTNIGAMQSIIDDDINGRLVSPGSITELTSVISNLWPEKQRCKKLGIQGKNKALALYSRKVSYNTLMAIYDKAINNCKFQR